jgi:hypothetical protein
VGAPPPMAVILLLHLLARVDAGRSCALTRLEDGGMHCKLTMFNYRRYRMTAPCRSCLAELRIALKPRVKAERNSSR